MLCHYSLIGMDIDELKIQVALGIITDEILALAWFTKDCEILRTLSKCTDLTLKKAVSVNGNCPYSVIKVLLSDDNVVVRYGAWEHIVARYHRRFNSLPPINNVFTDSSDLSPYFLIYPHL